MKIGIRFADNDFYNTVQAFMSELAASYRSASPDRLETFAAGLTKARIVELFNRSAIVFYWLHQNRFTYDAKFPENYLIIEEKNVYLGNEVDEHISSSGGWDNGEFHFIDPDNSPTTHCI